MSLTFSDGGIFNAGGGFFFHEEMLKDIFLVREVPEPASLKILFVGAAMFLARLWRRKKPS